MAKKLCVYEAVIEAGDIGLEDSGQALIIEVGSGGDDGLFCRLQSWSDWQGNIAPKHPAWMEGAVGKRLHVTVEEV
jgi:hypothetical protein